LYPPARLARHVAPDPASLALPPVVDGRQDQILNDHPATLLPAVPALALEPESKVAPQRAEHRPEALHDGRGFRLRPELEPVHGSFGCVRHYRPPLALVGLPPVLLDGGERRAARRPSCVAPPGRPAPFAAAAGCATLAKCAALRYSSLAACTALDRCWSRAAVACRSSSTTDASASAAGD